MYSFRCVLSSRQGLHKLVRIAVLQTQLLVGSKMLVPPDVDQPYVPRVMA
jgi:hypothetical protein